MTASTFSNRYKACFLGSLERVGWVTGGYRSVLLWRAGGPKQPKQSACAAGSTPPAPFPTGPLMIASRDLATAVFSECSYLDRFAAATSRRHLGVFSECSYLGRFAARGLATNRRTLCRGPERAHSWASLVGDCAIGHAEITVDLVPERGRRRLSARWTYDGGHFSL